MNVTGKPLPEYVALNEADVAEYLDVVFGYTSGFVAVRMLTEKGLPDGPPWSAFLETGDGLLPGILTQAKCAIGANRALFVVPGTVASRGSAKAGDIAEMAVILVDLDKGDIAANRAHMIQHLGSPTLEVASGGKTADGQDKLHLYWRLTEAARGHDVKRIAAIRAVIAAKAGGDPSFDSAHQPIRVAGSIHGKFGKKTPVRILARSARDYDLAELEESVACMPPMAAGALVIAASTCSLRKGPRATDLLMQQIHEGGADELTRYRAISSVTGHWIYNVRSMRATLDRAWTALKQYNTAMIVPPWPEERLLREFDALLKKDIIAYGPFPRWEESENASAPEQSEDAIAAEFAAYHAVTWRNVPVWGAWFFWNGAVWQKDSVAAVREAVRQTCRAIAIKNGKPNEARRIASDKTIAAVLRIASSDPVLTTRTEEWDADPMVLNCTAGLVDLETGEITSHSPADLITRLAPASGSGTCPRWIVFIDEITGGDNELAAYIKRVCGYCLTGSTREQVFFFLHGFGANGKSVFLQTCCAVFGDYATTAALDTFMASQGERHSTDLAGLRGARLVVVSETEPGRAWAETRIKAISGGDKISARFMHRDFFEFTPTFKLMVAGNHRPRLTGVGEAWRRRIHLIPFSVTIPAEKRDGRLVEHLAAERDGILGWMLQGGADWLKDGLHPPKCVLDAAQDYFEDEDQIGQWLATQCQQGDGVSATADDLYQNWKRFAEAAGQTPGTKKSLGEALRERGFLQSRTSRARLWLGLAPRGSEREAP